MRNKYLNVILSIFALLWILGLLFAVYSAFIVN